MFFLKLNLKKMLFEPGSPSPNSQCLREWSPPTSGWARE